MSPETTQLVSKLQESLASLSRAMSGEDPKPKLKIGDALRKAVEHPEVQARRRKFLALSYLAKDNPNLRLSFSGRGGWWCQLQKRGEFHWIFTDGMDHETVSRYFS